MFHPGTKFEYMLILVGGQGAGKSTFFRFLAMNDSWFTDDLKKLDDENVFRKMQGHLIIELSEMIATASARSIEDIKSFISRQSDIYKVPYETQPKGRPSEIQEAFPGIKGFNRRGLYRMKQFYETYKDNEIVTPLVTQISWTNHLLIMSGYLTELLKDENNSMWSAVLYGISYSDGEIVTVALSQVGNVGGEPYWSWYDFNSRVEWCACFVSWCANECGYIDTGVIPKFAGCVNGAQWFKDRGQWLDGSAEPVPGMIIFFDWESDGETDHVGIVEKVENGIVYTVEGNSGDSCRINQYSVGNYQIYGYGVPQY